MPKGRVAFAENAEEVTEEQLQGSINDILGDIDTNELDDYLSNDFNLDFFSVLSFKDLVANILSGKYFGEYDTLFGSITLMLKQNFKSLFAIFVLLFVLVLIYELFACFCPDKFSDFKKSIKIIFSLLVSLILLIILKNFASQIAEVTDKIFKFINILFPILLNLLLLSGATGTHSVYSSLSAFVLNTGSYIFVYILLPISISIILLTVVGSTFSNKRFGYACDILKSVFKYIVMIFFGVFGVVSAINLIISGTHDGVGLKLTKFAIKNYVPLLGGYISEGFDFVHTSAVLIKNAFGVCGIFALMFIVLKPLLVYFVYIIMFKILSVCVSFVSDGHFASLFNNVSKCFSYFVAILVGLFIIFFIFIYLMIISVSVV